MITMWYLQSHRTWDRFCHSCIGSSSSPSGPSRRTSLCRWQRRCTPDRSKLFGSHGQRPWLHGVVNLVFFTCLGEVNLVPRPGHAPLIPEGRLGIIRRVDPLSRRGHVTRRAPTHPTFLVIELAEPDPSEDLQGRYLPHVGRSTGPGDRLEQPVSIGADDLAVGVPGLLSFGQPRLLDSGGIALIPLGRGPRSQPARLDGRQAVQRGPEG